MPINSFLRIVRRSEIEFRTDSVVLGGIYQKGRWDLAPSGDDSKAYYEKESENL